LAGESPVDHIGVEEKAIFGKAQPVNISVVIY
jgi:hypothetical protein